jgi:tetratricopeptide (TPR) repeat protein
MSRLASFSAFLTILLSSLVHAQETSAPKSLVPPEVQVARPSPAHVISPNVRNAAASLAMDPVLMNKASQALSLIYARDYVGARQAFSDLHRTHPELAIGNVGRMLIFQCLMLENFDYRFERQYASHAALAIRDIEEAQRVPGNEAWEHFLKGGVLGIQAIHEMRKGDFVSSLRKGLEALGSLRALEASAPDFVDPDLGYGLFFYWRTVIGKQSPLIPDGEDRRAEGIALIEKVERQGAFVAPGATLALAYLYSEQGKSRKASSYSRRLKVRYPNNVINGLLHTRLLMRMRRYSKALESIDHVLSVDTDNHRVHYYRATVHLRQNQLDKALSAIDVFLEMPLEEDAKAFGSHRKADIYFRQGNYTQARKFYKEAVSINGYAPSKRRLNRIAQMNRQ